MDRIAELVERHPALQVMEAQLRAAVDALITCYKGGGTVFVAGNGGSASDASHIVGELMKAFVKPRPVPADEAAKFAALGADGEYLSSRLQVGLPALSLMTQEGITTAAQNDLGWDMGPAQCLYAMGKRGDVLIGISTSGNARNVSLACQVAKVKGMVIIGLDGKEGGLLAKASDIELRVPEKETFKIQELHLPIYHALCLAVEEAFF